MAEDTGGPCDMRGDGGTAEVVRDPEEALSETKEPSVAVTDETDGISSVFGSREFWKSQDDSNGTSSKLHHTLPRSKPRKSEQENCKSKQENHKVVHMNDLSWLKQKDEDSVNCNDADIVKLGSPVSKLRHQFASSRECTNGAPVTKSKQSVGQERTLSEDSPSSPLKRRIDMFEKSKSHDGSRSASEAGADETRSDEKFKEVVIIKRNRHVSDTEDHPQSELQSTVDEHVMECCDQAAKMLSEERELNHEKSVIDSKMDLGFTGESSTDPDQEEAEIDSKIDVENPQLSDRKCDHDNSEKLGDDDDAENSGSGKELVANVDEKVQFINGTTLTQDETHEGDLCGNDFTLPQDVTVDGAATPSCGNSLVLMECAQCGSVPEIPTSSTAHSNTQHICSCNKSDSKLPDRQLDGLPDRQLDVLPDRQLDGLGDALHKENADQNGQLPPQHEGQGAGIFDKCSRLSKDEDHSVTEGGASVVSNSTWYCSLEDSGTHKITLPKDDDRSTSGDWELTERISVVDSEGHHSGNVVTTDVSMDHEDCRQDDVKSATDSLPDGASDVSRPDGAVNTDPGHNLAQPIIAAKVTESQGQGSTDDSCLLIGQSLFYVDVKKETIGQEQHVTHSCVGTAVADPDNPNKHHLVSVTEQSSLVKEASLDGQTQEHQTQTCTDTEQPPSPSSDQSPSSLSSQLSQGNTQQTSNQSDVEDPQSNQPISGSPLACSDSIEGLASASVIDLVKPVDCMEDPLLTNSYAEQDILRILGSPKKRESTYVRSLSTFGKKSAIVKSDHVIDDIQRADSGGDSGNDSIDDILQFSLTLADELKSNAVKPLKLEVLQQVVPVTRNKQEPSSDTTTRDDRQISTVNDLYFSPETQSTKDTQKPVGDCFDTFSGNLYDSCIIDYPQGTPVTCDNLQSRRDILPSVRQSRKPEKVDSLEKREEPVKKTGILKKVQKFFRSESPQDISSDLDGSLDSINSSPVVLRKRCPNTPSPKLRKRPVKGSPSPKLKLKFSQSTPSVDSDGESPRGSEDSEDDEDAGIYGESHRNSRWLYLGDDLATVAIDIDGGGDISPNINRSRTSTESEHSGSLGRETPDTSSSGDLETPFSSNSDMDTSREVNRSFDCGLSHTPSFKDWQWGDAIEGYQKRSVKHCRSESISTTVSEKEFRKRYHAKTTRIVQRKSSTHAYQRMSDRFYDEERVVILEKESENQSFGFHIKGSQPVRISTIEAGGISEAAGLKVGDVIMSVNGINVLEASHQEVVKLMGEDSDRVKLSVSADRMLMDEPLCEGYLIKQGGSGFLKNWRRRWFALKPDHCLYYYKTHEDKDPLGAILMTNYTISKAPEINRRFTFKAMKYGQRTYLFQAESENEMNTWASAMSKAAAATTKTDTWLDISSHNVGLPALSIKTPDCHGYLCKMGHRHKNWKRRYCVLKDACLYYYLDVMSSTAQGVAHLHGYELVNSLPFRKTYGFTLMPPEPNMRTFYFYGDNDTDKKRWIDALKKSIGRWVRAEDHEC